MLNLNVIPTPTTSTDPLDLAASCQQWRTASGITSWPMDTNFPNGCPPGYSLVQKNAPSGNQPCGLYWCTNPSGQTVTNVEVASKCGPDVMTYMLIGGGILGFIALDGWLKLLGVGAAAAGLLQGIGTHMMAQVNPVTGQITCVRASTSW